ncbi:hypothetical protein B0H14DRAFT_2876174 [Mycena olivaceomarginata]|nr:hypothetical protein B0H14DRAFT_2876174 [Mycena olivaceomarginata]
MHPIKFNLTVDDFDSLITYPNQSHWTTPDPSAAPDPVLAIWFDSTYHRTNVSGASLSYSFKGSDLFLFGAAGPQFGSYEIELDGRRETHSAHASQNASGHLLFSKHGLNAEREHELKVTNLGPKHKGEGTDLLVDFVKSTAQIVASQGTTLANTTLEETDVRLVYTGNWTENVFNPLFSGGFSRFTNGDGASVTLNFTASALYILGDKTDRHGLYTVSLDGAPPTTFNGVSGCGGAFAHACEKDNTLAYFATFNDEHEEREHRVTVTNVPGELGAFFDLDAFILTTASYPSPPHSPRELEVEGRDVRGVQRRSSGAGPNANLPGLNLILFVLFLFALAGIRAGRR